jgi:hypothetical protein
MADQPSKYRRFRFHPWTLFPIALLAVLCAYVAYEHRIVDERRGWLDAHPVRGNIDTLDSLKRLSVGDPTRGPSRIRIGAFGDVPRNWVIVPRAASAAEKQEAAALFPEADILEGPPIWDNG